MESSACRNTGAEKAQTPGNLFDDCAWLYALCREYLFRDHTKEIIEALFPEGPPREDATIVEVGCGPGYYARKLAKRYPTAGVFGIDRSSEMVSWARRRAVGQRVSNCHFIVGDVQSTSSLISSVDALVSSRLFLVVPDRAAALAEMFLALKPGGRLFLAEPTADLKTRLPLAVMRLASNLSMFSQRQSVPREAQILGRHEFEALVGSQPWKKCSIRMHGDYQFAICEKGLTGEPTL